MMDKKTLRKVYLEKRRFLSDAVFAERNVSLVRTFLEYVPLAPIRKLHLFLPIAKFKEVDTLSLMEAIKKQYPHIDFVVPKVVDGSRMEHYLYEGPEQLDHSHWGIPEPSGGITVQPSEIDMVLIPLISFDRSGNRIGYGKGYYDRFLAACKPSIPKIGLSLSPPLDIIPYQEPHDIPLDTCISHRQCYRF